MAGAVTAHVYDRRMANTQDPTVDDVKQRILKRMVKELDSVQMGGQTVQALAQAYATLHEARPKSGGSRVIASR